MESCSEVLLIVVYGEKTEVLNKEGVFCWSVIQYFCKRAF